jgi:hypothetical protein
VTASRVLPMGAHTRTCVCGYPIHAATSTLTVHELKCLGLWPPHEDKADGWISFCMTLKARTTEN